jgi:hypothetical protein
VLTVGALNLSGDALTSVLNIDNGGLLNLNGILSQTAERSP